MMFNVKPEGGRGKTIAIIVLSVVAVICVAVCILTRTTNLLIPEKEYAALILYEGPKPIPASTAVSMKVDGHELFVYDTAVNNTHSWDSRYNPPLSTAPITSFDFDGAPVTMEITVNGQTELGEVLVRPLAKGVTPTVAGNVITFQVAEPEFFQKYHLRNSLAAVKRLLPFP